MAQLDDKVEKVAKIDRKTKLLDPNSLAQDPDKRVPPNKDHFDSLMVQNEQLDAQDKQPRVVETSKSSLIDEVSKLERKVGQVPRVSPTELVDQAKQISQQIDGIKQKLSAPNVEVKASVQNLLRNKLSHINENLQIALQKAGVEYTPPKKTAVAQTPIERFLNLLTDAQYRIDHIGNDVLAMLNSKDQIAPAAMLAVQIKVGFIQSELEFFSNMLNQALTSTKTIMNVQV